jgi:hypothetical protein
MKLGKHWELHLPQPVMDAIRLTMLESTAGTNSDMTEGEFISAMFIAAWANGPKGHFLKQITKPVKVSLKLPVEDQPDLLEEVAKS